MKFYFLTCVFTFALSTYLLAQPEAQIWLPIPNYKLNTNLVNNQNNMPVHYGAFRLHDQEVLDQLLNDAPLRFSNESNKSEIVIDLPMPNGKLERFKIYSFPVLESRLALAYPNLKTYTAMSLTNPSITAKIERTPQGFTGMILGAEKGAIFIKPYNLKDSTYYSFYNKDLPISNQPFVCEVEEMDEFSNESAGNNWQARAGDCRLRQYRLALACTGEYTQIINDGDDSNGDAVADVLADMVIVMNRVNGIFERDAGLTMLIIAENESIIFTDPDTDPYTNSSNTALISENNTYCRNNIGDENFDIGHVLGVGGGGLAFIESPCSFNKGQGASRRNIDDDERFISTLVHEMGHQYGTRHTHVNDCFRSSTFSYEPGSGSTIMSYAGLCPPLVQSTRDPYFHGKSIEAFGDFVISPDDCATILSTSNNPPIADAGNDFIIPISTPFFLEGTVSDADNDPITYCWEQFDREFTVQPPSPLSTEGPSIRSFPPTLSPIRYIPQLSTLSSGAENIWEVLPEVSRDLNFRLTVRDNNNAYGCTDQSNMKVSTDASSGPFVITAPDTTTTWNIGDTEIIEWDVANTDVAPVSCANIDILYSTDGGLTFPFTLATGVPNNGSFPITVPDVSSARVRIMVRCSDNIFFDITDFNILIETVTTCVIVNSTDVNIRIQSGGTSVSISDLEVPFDEIIEDINVVNLTGIHSNVSDLEFSLISPLDTSCLLVDQQCELSTDFNVNFDDNGNALNCPYNDGQVAMSVENLNKFRGSSSAGNWRLRVADLVRLNGGELLTWGLEICFKSALVSNSNLFDSKARISLVPNPVGDILNVSVMFDNSFNGQLQIINLAGQIIEQNNFRSDGEYEHQIQVSSLPSGLYFLRVIDENGLQSVERFVKQ